VIDERWRQETELLTRSWMQHDATMLANYLVSSVEDPRINIQSVLTRHWLVLMLFGDRFTALRHEELRFATVLNWLLPFLNRKPLPEEVTALVDALQKGADNSEGDEIPPYVVKAFQALPVTADNVAIPNYIQEALADYLSTGACDDSIMNVFQQRWASALKTEKAPVLSVVEPGCGSANEYRFFAGFGLAKFLDYTGFDLCAKNVQNARAMFPETRFEVGNVLQIDARDECYDCCFVHDLLEHLSVPAMEQAISEMCRVTRHGICLNFFQMDEIPNHVVRPVRDYHINLLSMEKVRQNFEAFGATVEVIHIETLLRMCFHCAQTHNPDAYTFYVRSA
jgi:SAM-dependent methyltransferase